MFSGGAEWRFLHIEDSYVIETFLQIIMKYRINEVSDILGLIITLVGFLFTTIALIKSKKATTNLKIELEKVRHDLRRTETVSDTASALALMDEIKRLHRQSETLQLLPERYSALRKALISIRSNNPILDLTDQQKIQEAISQLASFERKVESILSGTNEALNIPKINSILSSLSDTIQELLVKIRNSIGG